MDKFMIQPIIDLFPVLQGEGMYAGIPHILIRTSGCNLRCSFKTSLCDTAYSSWYSEPGKYSLQDVYNVLSSNDKIHHVMITGGEPTLHMPLVEDLVSICRGLNKIVTLETNGTIPYPHDKNFYVDLVSISPKLKNSIPYSQPHNAKTHEERRENIFAIASWILNSRNYQLKYVISDEADIQEVTDQVNRIFDQIKRIDPLHKDIIVYLMPEGDTEEKLKEKRQWLSRRCIELGYYYTDRLHIIIWGSKREA